MENKITQFIFNKAGVPNSQKYLDLASLRQKLISGNIANVSTPGYKAKDIQFHNEFQKVTQSGNRVAGATTHQAHIPTGNHIAKPARENEEKVQIGEMNSVDIDREFANLNMNSLRYEIGATLLQRKFEGLRKAIQSK